MSRSRKLVAGVLAVLAAGCAPPPAARTPEPPVAAPRAPPSAPAALPKRSAGLQVVLDLHPGEAHHSGESSLDLQPMRGRTFVTAGDVIFYVSGDRIETDPALQRGLADRPRTPYLSTAVGTLGGQWPEAAWAQVTERGERYFRSSFRRWNGAEWVREREGGYGVASQIVPLAHGWSVAFLDLPALYSDYSHGAPNSFLLLHPRWSVPVMPREAVDSLASLPDGSLYAAVDGRVLLWGPDGERRSLPAPAYGTKNETPVRSQIVVLSPTAVFLLNRRNDERAQAMDLAPTTDPPRPEHQLLRFDGQRWWAEPTPTGAPDRIFAGPRGALWVGEGDALHERAADGSWAELDVPAPLAQVWISPEDDVWATSGGTLLLHTRPLPEPFDRALLTPAWEPPSLGDEWCESLTALLDEVPGSAPADVDLRAQIDAMKPVLGKLARYVAFYDLRVAGKRRLAMHVPQLNLLDGGAVRRVGAELVARAKERGAPRPRLVCVKVPEQVDEARLLQGAAPVPEPPVAKARPRPERVSLDGCVTPLVVLFAPAKGAPASFDFPVTRRALAGHAELAGVRFFDFVRMGKRVIAASAPNKKAALGLADLVKRAVVGSAPTPVCAAVPGGAREIRVDLASGDVKN